MSKKVLDVIVVGSGLSSLSFIDSYLEKNKKIDLISPNIKSKIDKTDGNTGYLPSQMRYSFSEVNNFFFANKIKNLNNSKLIGSLKFGGLSNYWGLQMDNYISDKMSLSKKTQEELNKNFIEFLKKRKIIGEFFYKKKKIYSKNYTLKDFYNNFHTLSGFIIKKPILGFSQEKKSEIDLNLVNENLSKINSINFFRSIKKKINIHNFYVLKIEKEKNYIKIFCKNLNKEKIFYTKKLILGTGTIATTKIIMDYLKIKKEVKIKHHPRLISVYFSKFKIHSRMKFTPSLLQIFSSKKNEFTSDIRPGNYEITNSIIDLIPIIKPISFIINFLQNRLIFSNTLLSSKFSNLFIKKNKQENEFYEIYAKKNNLPLKNLIKKQKKVYNFLKFNKIIYPIYKNFFPGYGADFHYFGTITMNKKNLLSVNEKCQLKNNKNIYIVDGSVFDFKENRYPLGIVIANARRIGKLF